MAELDVEEREVNASPKVIMLTLSGGVDVKSYPKLEQALKHAHKQGCTRLVLNLAGLRFMNESEKLLKYDTAFRRVGGGIVLYEVPAKLRVMFTTLELDKKLPFHSSLDSAVKALVARKPTGAIPIQRVKPKPEPEASPAEEAPAAAEPEAAPAPAPEPAPAPKPKTRTKPQRKQEPEEPFAPPPIQADGGSGVWVGLFVLLLVVLGGVVAWKLQLF